MEEWTPKWLVDKFRDSDIGNDILIGIDEVPWQELHHAYGAADDVPPLLRAILSNEYDHGDFALQLLFGNIWHQRTVYQATRFVAPFLIQVLRSDSVFLKHRISIVHLLGCMANGNSYFDVHYELDPEWSEKYFKETGTSKEEVLERELRDVRLARESVLKQKEQLLDLIDHPDAELACNVYMLLGGFREFATELFSKFVKKYYQESLYEKSNAILEALRQLTLATDDNLSFFRRVIQEENRIELRAVAAMALIETQKQAVDAITMNVLWDFVKYRVDHEEKIEEMPSWKFVHDETTSIRAISRILIELSSPPNVTTFNTFVTLLKDPDRVFEFVQDLFFYLYQDDRYKGVVGLHSSRDGRTVTKYCRRGLIEVELIDPMDPIREEFISILQMVVALPLFWEVESNLLNVFGLPHAKDDIAKLIEKFHMNAKIT